MPTRLRSLGRSVLGSVTTMPSTVISPFCTGSSALTVLIRVDLPEPEGPQTTTTSPLLILTEQSVSTCTGPYHLEMFLISITMFFLSINCSPAATRGGVPGIYQRPPRIRLCRAAGGAPLRGRRRRRFGGGLVHRMM